MELVFRTVSEDQPGPKWAGLFRDYWPSYRRFWTRDGAGARPTYLASRRALGRHMPELLELYDELCELVGGGDEEARFLSFYCPPPYLAGCSQAIWPGAEPTLVRNYDYDPRAFDAVLLRTSWSGRQVIGTSDGLLGLVDGMNDAGLGVSLTFGGRRIVGDGFGVPLILRYILQVCETCDEAVAVLQRIPCHMSYNVTLLDRQRRFATVFLAPDRKAVVTHAAVATNHQARVEWSSHARLTASVERERYLLQRLTLHVEPQEKFIDAFLKPPLYSVAFDKGFGTLYTAAYQPRLGQMTLMWPKSAARFSFSDFPEQKIHIAIPAQAPREALQS